MMVASVIMEYDVSEKLKFIFIGQYLFYRLLSPLSTAAVSGKIDQSSDSEFPSRYSVISRATMLLHEMNLFWKQLKNV